MLSQQCSLFVVFFLMIRRPPRSTLDRSSSASDVYKRQNKGFRKKVMPQLDGTYLTNDIQEDVVVVVKDGDAVSYTHLRAHETVLDLVCRLLLEKKKTSIYNDHINQSTLQNNNLSKHTPLFTI